MSENCPLGGQDGGEAALRGIREFFGSREAFLLQDVGRVSGVKTEGNFRKVFKKTNVSEAFLRNLAACHIADYSLSVCHSEFLKSLILWKSDV